MSQTQLASMYLGNPYIADRDERLKGVSSQLSATIHILDGQSNHGIILDYITARNIISDLHKKSLEDTLETYQFITFADRRYSQYLEKRNRIIIPDEDGTLVEFVMFEVEKYKDTEGHKAQVFAHASYLELKKASILYPDNGHTNTASQHAGRALNDTGWQVGTVEGKGTITMTINEHTNPYEFLKRIAKEFDVELNFRVEHDGNRVTGRYVDLLERVGEWRGREVEFGKDLDGIRRVEKQDIVTALLGLGPEKEDGTRIEVLVTDDDALRRWGRVDEHGDLKHLIEVYEIQSERTEMTVTEARQYTRTALNKRINAQVTFETTIIDLENVPGMQNKKIRFGDTIRIKDTSFNPPLYLEARIFEQSRSIKSQAKIDFKLGDFVEFTEDEVNAVWLQLRNEIRKRVSVEQLREYAEPKKVESDTAPIIKEGENPIWVDMSKIPHVPHVVIAGVWQKMSPTNPAEVNAYTKAQVDSRDSATLSSAKTDATNKANAAQSAAEAEAEAKAAQALADAKAFSENASNITEGVVDVGAVPLRTSITGARLEWDGVNGLVQYNQDGDPVSWIDLDANAHFANAFLSGRIEASEGFFGDNIKLRNGKMEIVRPDGAISMSDGLLYNSYSVSQDDPYFMTTTSNDTPGAYRDHIFVPGGVYGSIFTAKSWYVGIKYMADGRDQGSTGFRDVRDAMGCVAFQRYEFIHSSRYLVFNYWPHASSGKHSIHVLNGHSDNIDDRIYFQLLEAGTSGIQKCVIDLGKPTFETREVTFKIGWTDNWGSSDDEIIFRMKNINQTDVL